MALLNQLDEAGTTQALTTWLAGKLPAAQDVTVNDGNMLIAAGAFPPEHPMPVSNPASQILAKLLGLPAPEGDPASFVEAR